MVSTPCLRWISFFVCLKRAILLLIAALASAAALAQTAPPKSDIPLPPPPRFTPPVMTPARVYKLPEDSGRLPSKAPARPKLDVAPVVAAAVEDPAGGTDHLTPMECGIGCEYAINQGLEKCDGFVDRHAPASAVKAPSAPACRGRLFEAYERCLIDCGTPLPYTRQPTKRPLPQSPSQPLAEAVP